MNGRFRSRRRRHFQSRARGRGPKVHFGMSVESLLVVFENAEAFEQYPTPEPNSGINKVLRNDLVGYPILDPFKSVHLVGFQTPLSAEEAKALKSIMTSANSKLSLKECSDAFVKASKMTLLLAGFILDPVTVDGFQLSATPANFTDGAAVAINNTADIWNTAAQSGDYEVIDQDDLITEEDLLKPTPSTFNSYLMIFILHSDGLWYRRSCQESL